MENQRKLILFDETLTREDVLGAFIRAAGAPGDIYDWRSVKVIACNLGCSKSVRLYKLLAELASDHLLDVQLYRRSNGVDMLLYALTERGLKEISQ